MLPRGVLRRSFALILALGMVLQVFVSQVAPVLIVCAMASGVRHLLCEVSWSWCTERSALRDRAVRMLDMARGLFFVV